MFVTFEGIDGSGKSTILKELCVKLRAKHLHIFQTYEPGASSLGQLLRPMILSCAANLNELAELFLFLADRAQHVASIIKPALLQGQIVVCDRYIDSTIAYQGYGRGLSVDKLRILNQIATNNLVPDVTFLLDLPVNMALERVEVRNKLDQTKLAESRFDKEVIAFHEHVRQGYLQEAKQNKRFVIIDASRSIESISEFCYKYLIAKLGVVE